MTGEEPVSAILDEEEPANNGLGIAAKVDNAGVRFYSIQEAGLLLGQDPSTIHRHHRQAPTLTGPDQLSRKYVPAEAIDSQRRDLLEKLGAIERAGSGPEETVPGLSSVDLENLVRELLVADDLAAEAEQLHLRRTAIYRNAVRQLMPVRTPHD